MAKGKSKRHASALKAHRKSLVRKEFNNQVRNRIRTLTAKVLKDIAAKDKATATTSFRAAQSAWQKAAKTGIFNKSAAARKIGILAKKIAKL